MGSDLEFPCILIVALLHTSAFFPCITKSCIYTPLALDRRVMPDQQDSHLSNEFPEGFCHLWITVLLLLSGFMSNRNIAPVGLVILWPRRASYLRVDNL